MVTNAAGVTDIETEQCREQEQEKEQEQEQEQEIEMERYVDMAYQRDGEEPMRWAFCSLGETRRDTDGATRAAPFADGAFYPAASFRLHARSALPFPEYLSVSRNHFDLALLLVCQSDASLLLLSTVLDRCDESDVTCAAN